MKTIVRVRRSDYHLDTIPTPFMEGWRGKAFSDEEFEAFDLQNMLGKPAILTIIEDGEYRAINGISRLIAGMTPPARFNDEVFLSLEPGEFNETVYNGLSDKMKAIIAESPEFKALNGHAVKAATREQPSDAASQSTR